MATRLINIGTAYIWMIPLVLATIGALALAIGFNAFGIGATQGSELVGGPWWWPWVEPHFYIPLPGEIPPGYYYFWGPPVVA